MNLKWTDTREIAALLARRHPEMDPLAVRLADLSRMVQESPGFADDAGRSTPKILEAIQSAWLDEVSD